MKKDNTVKEKEMNNNSNKKEEKKKRDLTTTNTIIEEEIEVNTIEGVIEVVIIEVKKEIEKTSDRKVMTISQEIEMVETLIESMTKEVEISREVKAREMKLKRKKKLD
jgi:hypothetical protein